MAVGQSQIIEAVWLVNHVLHLPIERIPPAARRAVVQLKQVVLDQCVYPRRMEAAGRGAPTPLQMK